MTSIFYVKQAEIIEAFKSTALEISGQPFKYWQNPDIEGMVNQIYPTELQLNKANTSDTEAPFWICIYPFQTYLFHLKFMSSAMTLILIL